MSTIAIIEAIVLFCKYLNFHGRVVGVFITPFTIPENLEVDCKEACNEPTRISEKLTLPFNEIQLFLEIYLQDPCAIGKSNNNKEPLASNCENGAIEIPSPSPFNTGTSYNGILSTDSISPCARIFHASLVKSSTPPPIEVIFNPVLAK